MNGPPSDPKNNSQEQTVMTHSDAVQQQQKAVTTTLHNSLTDLQKQSEATKSQTNPKWHQGEINPTIGMQPNTCVTTTLSFASSALLSQDQLKGLNPLLYKAPLSQTGLICSTNMMQAATQLTTQPREHYFYPGGYRFEAPIPVPTPTGVILPTSNQEMDPMVEILRNINEKLGTIQTDIKDLKDSKTEISNQIAGLPFDQEDDHELLIAQQQESKSYFDKVDLLSELTIKQDNTIQQLQSKIDKLEARLMKSELLVFRLLEEGEKTCKTIAAEFFTHKLEMNPPPEVQMAYWKGNGKNKPMVIKLVNSAQKGLVFANLSKLKNKKNAKEKGYRVVDHLPETLAEEQNRLRQIVINNRNLVDGNRLNMVMKKGKLTIGNEPYRKKWRHPTLSSCSN